jgi:hypothetical protein
MAETLTREQLYELVWTQPLKALSTRFGVSDVTLKKCCAKSDIPTPDRGYWAKKEAGKRVIKAALPLRPPGMSEDVLIAGGRQYWYRRWSREELLGPLPDAPVFPEPLDAVQARIAKIIGRVSVARDYRIWHPAVDRLLKADDMRRQKQASSSFHFSWDDPIFDSSFERRRLRILNALLIAVARMSGRSEIRGREGREISITFHQQAVAITLDRPKPKSQRGQQTDTVSDKLESRLRLAVLTSSGSEKERIGWSDDDRKLESRLTDIAIQVVLTAEIAHRESAQRHYEWRVETRAQLEEEERNRKIAAARAETERLARLDQERVDRLLRDAAAFRQARDIRTYIDALQTFETGQPSVSGAEFERWKTWTLVQADKIDPAIGRRFLDAMVDTAATQTHKDFDGVPSAASTIMVNSQRREFAISPRQRVISCRHEISALIEGPICRFSLIFLKNIFFADSST